MFGVVLWFDSLGNKGVIWCEEKGDLALFDPSECPDTDRFAFEPGDLVRFDVIRAGRFQQARNPQRVEALSFAETAANVPQAVPPVSTGKTAMSEWPCNVV